MRAEHCAADWVPQRLPQHHAPSPSCAHHKFHEATETPEGIHFVLNNEEDWGQEVTHALNVAWGNTGSAAAP